MLTMCQWYSTFVSPASWYPTCESEVGVSFISIILDFCESGSMFLNFYESEIGVGSMSMVPDFGESSILVPNFYESEVGVGSMIMVPTSMSLEPGLLRCPR